LYVNDTFGDCFNGQFRQVTILYSDLIRQVPYTYPYHNYPTMYITIVYTLTRVRAGTVAMFTVTMENRLRQGGFIKFKSSPSIGGHVM